MIAGIVLAAGRSSRMGQPKALLTLDGRVFLDRAIEALTGGGCGDVWVVLSDASHAYAATRAEDAGARIAWNLEPGAEQIDSLRAALRALPADAEAAVVLPVDVPRADPAVVSGLIAAFERTGAPIVVPVRAGRHGHPVLFARRVWPELLEKDLPEGARTVVHAHRAELVEVPVASLPEDVDTPEDYQRLLDGQ